MENYIQETPTVLETFPVGPDAYPQLPEQPQYYEGVFSSGISTLLHKKLKSL